MTYHLFFFCLLVSLFFLRLFVLLAFVILMEKITNVEGDVDIKNSMGNMHESKIENSLLGRISSIIC